MEVNKRRGVGAKGTVVAGSVWETRMKSDEVRGGIKVFNAEEQSNVEENSCSINGGGGSRLKRSPIGGKRKTWKSESSNSNLEEPCKELSVSSSSNGAIKKSPIHAKRIADKFERSSIHARKLRSDLSHSKGEPSEGQLRKSKSDSAKKNGSVQLRKTKSEQDRVPEGDCEKIEAENGKNNGGGDGDGDGGENCMDFDDVCQEKVISSSSENVNVEHGSTEFSVRVESDGGDGDGDDGSDDVGVDEMDDGDEEVEIEMEEGIEVKEISIPESQVAVNEPEKKVLVVNESEPKKVVLNESEPKKVVLNESEPKKVVSNESEPKKVVSNESEPKKVVSNESEPKKVVVSEPEATKILNEPESKRVVSAHMRFHHRSERRPVSVPLVQKQSPPIRRNSTIYQNFSKTDSTPKPEEYRRFPQAQQSKLQSLVDLIMWRDVSRSAFVFGFGTFLIASSSYAKDINLSLISVISYISLVYLAVIFLYRSLICRGIIEVGDSNYVLGEEDAIWMLKLILPYLNEFLSKLKALFSGDPGTTIKLAVLLFVLARCGNYITIWKMAKFGFFGVFTVPKICSSYSAQLTAYANFWIRRFRDAWDSCTHKKAVALGIFGLVWNLSSVVARVWAVFVLFVAFRYYQQHYMVRDEWGEDDETWQEPVGVRQKQGPPSNFVDTTNKVKKGF